MGSGPSRHRAPRRPPPPPAFRRAGGAAWRPVWPVAARGGTLAGNGGGEGARRRGRGGRSLHGAPRVVGATPFLFFVAFRWGAPSTAAATPTTLLERNPPPPHPLVARDEVDASAAHSAEVFSCPPRCSTPTRVARRAGFAMPTVGCRCAVYALVFFSCPRAPARGVVARRPGRQRRHPRSGGRRSELLAAESEGRVAGRVGTLRFNQTKSRLNWH